MLESLDQMGMSQMGMSQTGMSQMGNLGDEQEGSDKPVRKTTSKTEVSEPNNAPYE